MESLMVWLLVIVAFLVANVPWMSERFFVFFAPPGGVKRAWMRLLEWVVLYFVVGLLALGLEHKVSGENHPQRWEFYVVTLCLFLVFALPGFIYRYDLRHHLMRR